MRYPQFYDEPTDKYFEGWAQRLLQQSTKWTPVDRTIPYQHQVAIHHNQQRELSDVALLAGGAILRLERLYFTSSEYPQWR